MAAMLESCPSIIRFGYHFTQQGPRARAAFAITKNNELRKCPSLAWSCSIAEASRGVCGFLWGLAGSRYFGVSRSQPDVAPSPLVGRKQKKT